MIDDTQIIHGIDLGEGGRAFTGIHELIEGLPQLRHLWVNQRALAVPAFGNEENTWGTKPFEEEQDTIMSRTVTSPQWGLLGRTFEKLETLRVGFGSLNVDWAAKVLSLCDHTKLKAFGFDWGWEEVWTTAHPASPNYADQSPSAQHPSSLKPFQCSSL